MTILTEVAPIASGSFELVLVLTLLALLILKELSSLQEELATSPLGQVLVVGIVPLLIAFFLVVVVAVVGEMG